MLIEPIKYDYEPGCEELPLDRVEETLRIGRIFSRMPQNDTIIVVQDNRLVPDTLECMRVVMDAGLRAYFYPETAFAKFAEGPITVESLARRYRAVYEVSRRLGLEICPVAVIRSIPGLGRGLMIPAVCAKALVFVQMVDGMPRVSLRASKTSECQINEAIIFDYIVGSGQKLWYGYQVDPNGKVYSPYHHLAFTYSMAGRLAGILKKRRVVIRRTFFEQLASGEKRTQVKSALIQELMLLVGVHVTKIFDLVLDNLLDEKKLGDHIKIEVVE